MSIRAGDPRALEALFRALHAPLIRFATSLASDADDAHDLAQEAFVRLWEHRASLDPSLSIRAWLYRTVRNLAYNRTRDRTRQAELLGHNAVSPLSPPQADEDLEAAQTKALLHGLVASLPPRQREAFLLTRAEGLTHAEAAQSMDIAPATLNVHLVRALKTLRTALNAVS